MEQLWLTLPFAPANAAYCSSQLLEICVRVAHGTAPLWRGSETGACGPCAASFLAGDWTCLEQCGRSGAVDVAAGARRWLFIYLRCRRCRAPSRGRSLSDSDTQSCNKVAESSWMLWFRACAVIFGHRRDFPSRPWFSADYVYAVGTFGASLAPTWLSSRPIKGGIHCLSAFVAVWQLFSYFRGFFVPYEQSGCGKTVLYYRVLLLMLMYCAAFWGNKWLWNMNIERSDFIYRDCSNFENNLPSFCRFLSSWFFCSRTDGEIDSRRRNEVIIFDSVQSAVGYRL